MKIKKGGNVSRMLEGIPIPDMFRAEQAFDKSHIEPAEIPSIVRKELSRPEIADKIQPGMNIAITAGSRGVANVDIITRAIVDFCKERGADPFIVPAMGSHGGATAEGQAQLLKGYGITVETMGCPVRSSMETVLLGYSEFGKPVYQDRNAHEADGIIVSCRIKPHNAFRGTYESGICKMMVVGLGKQKGAESVHSDGLGNMARNLPANASMSGRSCSPKSTMRMSGRASIRGLPRWMSLHRLCSMRMSILCKRDLRLPHYCGSLLC